MVDDMAFHHVMFGERKVFIGSPADCSSLKASSPFAVLVAAPNTDEVREILSIAEILLRSGCKEFCCVGFESELLHDQLDLLIEKVGLLDVVTTWHKDVIEGCEYFLFGAGGQNHILYGLISGHKELIDALAVAARE